jgi:hypothetical protein
MGKAVKKVANSQRNAKQIETGNGKRLGRLQCPDGKRSGISNRDDRKENPDRDKDDS